MATVGLGTRRQRAEDFTIHEDVPATEDTEMEQDVSRADDDDVHVEDSDDNLERDKAHDEEEEEDDDDAQSESSEDDVIDATVQQDMEKLQNALPGFKNKYRLLKRIGEGTFSTVYKAEDLQYESFDNSWDMEKENEKWTPPPLKRFASSTHHEAERPTHATWTLSQQQQAHRRHRPKYVAVKKIYVTSSPTRIFNELELLHDLKSCPAVCPLITAFRATDQVVAVLPYYRHADFRDYFRNMRVSDVAIYLRSLFTALASVHAHGILHRDIKPTNFLYNPATRRGLLVDFGLAEREGSEAKPCLCHEDPGVRRQRLRAAYAPIAAAAAAAGPGNAAGYPTNDTRPSRRANRAGTRGFRAPEVLFKCTEQTTKIDIWSAGVVLLTILSRRFPFFNSADDVEAMVEIATIFGQKRMRQAAQLHGCMFESTIPTIGSQGFSLERIILWSTMRLDSGPPLSEEERLAVEFLGCCLELDPSRRISAAEALEHDFLRNVNLEASASTEEDELDILKV